jgi:hypothetical protein
MSLKLNSSGGGSVTLQEPTTASNVTLNLPAADGTIITTASTFAGTGPAFSAYQSSAQSSLSSNTWTKILFQTEEFDTNSNYDTSTSRFTPTVAGYYQVNASVFWPATTTFSGIRIYKNGSSFKQGQWSGSASAGSAIVSTLIYMNGTTDYLESYGNTQTSQSTSASQTEVYFQASLARAA